MKKDFPDPTILPWRVLNDIRPKSIQEVLWALLENRKVDPVSFLRIELSDLQSYMNLHNLEEASRIVVDHLIRRNLIVLVGDYDCDGITSVVQMSLFLKSIGYQDFRVVIPRREEGYGIPLRAVRDNPEARLFIAMDCGSSDVNAIQEARSQNADVIVIDHHELSTAEAAPATALVNPKQPRCRSMFKEFCSSGLTLLFIVKVRQVLSDAFPRPRIDGRYLALAAIGTVADMVPLVEGNRIIAQAGLAAINRNNYAALKQLCSVSRLERTRIQSTHIGFQLAPRINAAGRMDDPMLAYDLLMAEHENYAGILAKQLNQLNSLRQQQENKILRSIIEQLQRMNCQCRRQRTVVLGDPTWPHGLVGIVASKVQKDLHYGPVVLLSVNRDSGTAKGSARSVPGYDVHQALHRCQELLIRWGGHQMAAGLELAVENIDRFAQRFEEIARQHDPNIFVPKQHIDLELDLALVGSGLLEALSSLEPHGVGNPSPTFIARRKPVRIERIFGKDRNHLSIRVDNRLPAVFWNGIKKVPELIRAGQGAADVVFALDWDSYNKGPRLNIKALLPGAQ